MLGNDKISCSDYFNLFLPGSSTGNSYHGLRGGSRTSGVNPPIMVLTTAECLVEMNPWNLDAISI